MYDDAIASYTAALAEVPDTLLSDELAEGGEKLPLGSTNETVGHRNVVILPQSQGSLSQRRLFVATPNVEFAPPPPPPPSSANVARSKILGNRAQAAAQLRDSFSANADCTRALMLDPTNFKAAVRRALALEQMGHLRAALDQLEGDSCRYYDSEQVSSRGGGGTDRVTIGCRALAEWGYLPASLLKVVAAARHRVRSMLAQDERLLKGCREHETLINKQQTLRLHLTSAVPECLNVSPTSLAVDEAAISSPAAASTQNLGCFRMSISIANEFGLWRALDFADICGKSEGGDKPSFVPFIVRLVPQNSEARRSLPRLRVYPDHLLPPPPRERLGNQETACGDSLPSDSSAVVGENTLRIGESGRVSMVIEITFGDSPGGTREACSSILDAPCVCDPIVFIEVAPLRGSNRARSIMPVLTRPITLARGRAYAEQPQQKLARQAAKQIGTFHEESSATTAAVIGQPLEGDAVQREIPKATGDINAYSCRRFAVPALEDGLGWVDIVVAESPGYLGIGGKLWDAALVLMHFLRSPAKCGGGRHMVEGKCVVELGAGTGLVGLCCALCLEAKDVLITDIEEVCQLIDVNIQLNGLSEERGMGLGSSTLSLPLVWDDPPAFKTSPRISAVDTVVLSDVVYDPELYVPLVATLSELVQPASSPGIKNVDVLLAWRHRNPDDFRFWVALAAAGFTYAEIALEVLRAECGQSLCGACVDIRIFRIQRAVAGVAGTGGALASAAATAI